MKCIKKLIGLKVIIFIFCLTSVISANAAGFIFSWQPFIADAALTLDNPDKKILINNLSVADINIPISEDSRDIFPSSADQDSIAKQKSEKKFLSGNIKFTFYQISEFMPDRYEKYTNSEDEQLSKITNAMTSLIYGDSKIKSLETIGKIIEPQVNLYFEF
jgi:hypothetical protein